jgi:hypothetical protein
MGQKVRSPGVGKSESPHLFLSFPLREQKIAAKEIETKALLALFSFIS